jgi:hypothetical protein
MQHVMNVFNSLKEANSLCDLSGQLKVNQNGKKYGTRT